MTVIVDSSYVLRLIDRTDERGARVRAVHQPLREAHEMLAPELIHYEVLHVTHRQAQATIGGGLEHRQAIVATLLDGIEPVSAASGDREWIGKLAEAHGISAYDAAFLALAKSRPDSFFVTLDARLHAAARKELGDQALDLDGLEAHLA